MFHITALISISVDYTMAYRTSQDMTVGWHRHYTPRARRNLIDLRLLPRVTCLLISATPENYSDDAHIIITSRWLNQGGFVGHRFLPLPDNCVQQHRLPEL